MGRAARITHFVLHPILLAQYIAVYIYLVVYMLQRRLRGYGCMLLWYKKTPTGNHVYHRFHFLVPDGAWNSGIGGSMHGNCSAAGIRA